jgi:hypothetical protein
MHKKESLQGVAFELFLKWQAKVSGTPEFNEENFGELLRDFSKLCYWINAHCEENKRIYYK